MHLERCSRVCTPDAWKFYWRSYLHGPSITASKHMQAHPTSLTLDHQAHIWLKASILPEHLHTVAIVCGAHIAAISGQAA
jgi:hypothetical protein